MAPSLLAISGPANHLTSYGVFSGEARYTNDIDEILRTGSEGRFGSPPWVDPDPYVRNSPVSYLDRAETPLLILHGDIDYVPVQHAEEVFTSLARMGKRVRFSYYRQVAVCSARAAGVAPLVAAAVG